MIELFKVKTTDDRWVFINPEWISCVAVFSKYVNICLGTDEGTESYFSISHKEWERIAERFLFPKGK